MLSLKEHPYLQRPFYQLHPCHTANFMKDICGKCRYLYFVGELIFGDFKSIYFYRAFELIMNRKLRGLSNVWNISLL